MDDRLTTLMHDIISGYGRVKVWNDDGFAWYEYQVFDEDGNEIARSDAGYMSVLYCLRDGLDYLIKCIE